MSNKLIRQYIVDKTSSPIDRNRPASRLALFNENGTRWAPDVPETQEVPSEIRLGWDGPANETVYEESHRVEWNSDGIITKASVLSTDNIDPGDDTDITIAVNGVGIETITLTSNNIRDNWLLDPVIQINDGDFISLLMDGDKGGHLNGLVTLTVESEED